MNFLTNSSAWKVIIFVFLKNILFFGSSINSWANMSWRSRRKVSYLLRECQVELVRLKRTGWQPCKIWRVFFSILFIWSLSEIILYFYFTYSWFYECICQKLNFSFEALMFMVITFIWYLSPSFDLVFIMMCFLNVLFLY